MSIEKLKENYWEIAQYFDLFDNNKSYILKSSTGKTASIKLAFINKELKLSQQNLEKLNQLESVNNIYDLSINTYGMNYKEYHEFYIDINHPSYSGGMTFHFDDETWPISPLEFKIGNTIFMVGLASPLLVLLSEPIYRDSDFSYNFHNLTSMKIILKDKNLDIRNEFMKGLYYLNSFYLKPMQLYAELKSVELSYSDPLNLYSINSVEDILLSIKRTKNKKDIKAIEPLKLYNHAQLCKKEEKFLFLYRVFEFFMYEVWLEKIKKIRMDTSITENELIKTIEQKKEEYQLIALLTGAISQNSKNKIIKYAQTHKFIRDNNYESLIKALYKFRNSIVHAKEKQIQETIIPDPFHANSVIDPWIVIVDELAIKCIEKYN